MRLPVIAPAIAIATAIAIGFPAPAFAQIGDVTGGGALTLETFNESALDRFGNPTFGLRAQREPELRRLRKMAGRPILEGDVSIYDLTDEEIDAMFDELDKQGAQ